MGNRLKYLQGEQDYTTYPYLPKHKLWTNIQTNLNTCLFIFDHHVLEATYMCISQPNNLLIIPKTSQTLLSHPNLPIAILPNCV